MKGIPSFLSSFVCSFFNRANSIVRWHILNGLCIIVKCSLKILCLLFSKLIICLFVYFFFLLCFLTLIFENSFHLIHGYFNFRLDSDRRLLKLLTSPFPDGLHCKSRFIRSSLTLWISSGLQHTCRRKNENIWWQISHVQKKLITDSHLICMSWG